MNFKNDETPHMLAKQEFLSQVDGLIKAAHNWRLVAMGSIAGMVMLGGGIVYVASQTKIVPYVVELNGSSEPVGVRRADSISRPSENMIKASLRTWIIGARTVYGDPVAQQSHVETVYAMTLPNSPAYNALLSYHKENDPYVRAQRENVEVSVNAVHPITDETWQIEWTETTRNSGKTVHTRAWQGSFTVTIIPPTTDSQILVNPLGIYVKQFAWTSRI